MVKRAADRPFITPGFMLGGKTAQKLFTEYAERQPIIDYHCHLSPEWIAEDHKFRNLTELWLAGDHYKWRAMRTAGVQERFITGDASDYEKFEKFASSMPDMLRSPIYTWAHMELARPFGIHTQLSSATAREIWESANAKLAQPEFSCRGLLRQFDVRVVCTTDDPTDDLRHHQKLSQDSGFEILVLPTFRPDRALTVETPVAWNDWMDKLEERAGVEIRTFGGLVAALRKRAEDFAALGCRAADHGLEVPFAEEYTHAQVSEAFAKARAGNLPDSLACSRLKSAIVHEMGLVYHELDWAMQLHLGPIRNNSSRMFAQLGPDAGFDSMSDIPYARPLARLLDGLDRANCLPRTILYNLHPAQNEMLASMIGNFQDGSVRGKMQFGSAWWFMDQADGIRRQLEALSNLGLLACFVGMLTDSRSFVSYSRHDYFRRVLCDMLGNDIDRGLLPADTELAGRLVRKVCYENARDYFRFERMQG